MRGLASLYRNNFDILLFQLSNFLYSPLLYFLLGNRATESSLFILKTIYLVEVYLAVPVVIFYFNQRRTAEMVDTSGRHLYDGIALIKLAFSILTAFVVIYILKAAEPALLPIILASFFGNAITPHWLLTRHNYTVFTMTSLAFRALVLLLVLFGQDGLILACYAASLLLPGLFSFFYFRVRQPVIEQTRISTKILTLVGFGLLPMVRNFATSTLLLALLSSAPTQNLSLYATIERIIRSSFSFMVPYLLRANLRGSIPQFSHPLISLTLALGAALIYYFRPDEIIAWLIAAALVLSLDLIVFIHSERVGSELVSNLFYLLLGGIVVAAIFSPERSYLLLSLLALFPLLMKKTAGS